jgi:hypothetical protein
MDPEIAGAFPTATAFLAILTIPQPCYGGSQPSVYTAGSMPVRGAAMIQTVFGAPWFITLLIVVYGTATGNLCLWRRDD